MSYEAWGEPDGRPWPRVRVNEGDFRDFAGPTPCAPAETCADCGSCVRHRPALARVLYRSAVLIDATVVTKPGEGCPLFAPKGSA